MNTATYGSLFETEQVKSFTLSDNVLTLQLHQPDAEGKTELTYRIASFSVFYEDFNDMVVAQHEAGILEQYDYPAVAGTPWWLMIVPYVLVAAVFGYLAVHDEPRCRWWWR